MKRSCWYLLLLPVILMACKSLPVVEEPASAEPPDFSTLEAEPEPSPDSISVDQETYDFTLAEVKIFIDNLNLLISKKNYSGWKNTLSDELFARISSPEFLANASESAALKSRKIVLKSPNDYFTNVVVPSRSNSKVDEIEFTATDRVKVFYLEKVKNNKTGEFDTRRLRLYELVKSGDTWKIID